jgi:hypothetical protein
LKVAEIFPTTLRASRILIAKADRRRWESVLLKEIVRGEIVRMAVGAVDVLVVAVVAAAVAAAEGMAVADPVVVVEGTKTFATDFRGFSRIERTT